MLVTFDQSTASAGRHRMIGNRPVPAVLATRRELRTINDIIDERDLRTVFQPVVSPGSGEVVALEALVRGPEGSPFASPLALLRAGATVGRLGELDWACRAAAASAVLEHDIDPHVALFFKADSRALLDACPDDLAGVIDLAVRDRPCVTSVVLDDSDALLRVARVGLERLRSIGFSIALDSATDRVPSRRVLRLVGPEMVKVDARTLASLVSTRGPRALGALRAWLAGSGARLIVKNVEDREGAALALAAGARYAQGWHFGHPSSLDGINI